MRNKHFALNFAHMLALAFAFCYAVFTPVALYAQTTNTEAKAYPFAPMDENEMRLLQELEASRQELLNESRASQPQKPATVLNVSVNQAKDNAGALANALASKREIQLYMQMKPAKAAQIMESQDSEKVAYILNQMPAPFAARIIEKMSVDKAAYFLTLTEKRQP